MTDKYEKFKKWFVRRKFYVKRNQPSLMNGVVVHEDINPFEMFRNFEEDLVTLSLLNNDDSSEEKIKEIITDILVKNSYDRIMTESGEVYSTYGVVDKIYVALKNEGLIKYD